jgi:hypothetical protein
MNIPTFQITDRKEGQTREDEVVFRGLRIPLPSIPVSLETWPQIPIPCSLLISNSCIRRPMPPGNKRTGCIAQALG